MGKLIIIGGDLAAGKTTFSKYLTDKLNIVSVNKDKIKEILGDNFGFSNREENLKLSICTFELMLSIANNFMEGNQDLILESNFRQHELDKLQVLANEYHYDVLSLVLNGDIHIMHNRFMKRINEGRHSVHKAQDLSNYEDFLALTNKMREVKYIGDVIVLDPSSFDELYSPKVLEKITNYVKGE